MVGPSTKAGGLGGEAVDAGCAALLDLAIPQGFIPDQPAMDAPRWVCHK